jgi:hypothetical protein
MKMNQTMSQNDIADSLWLGWPLLRSLGARR